MRVTHSRGREDISGADDRVFRDYRTETGGAQVGQGPHAGADVMEVLGVPG